MQIISIWDLNILFSVWINYKAFLWYHKTLTTKKAYGNLGLLNYCCLNQILLPLYTMKAKWINSWKVTILYTCINLPLMNVCDIVHVNLQWWKRDRFRTERAEALHKAFFANIFKAHIFIWYKCSKGSWLVINNIN